MADISVFWLKAGFWLGTQISAGMNSRSRNILDPRRHPCRPKNASLPDLAMHLTMPGGRPALPGRVPLAAAVAAERQANLRELTPDSTRRLTGPVRVIEPLRPGVQILARSPRDRRARRAHKRGELRAPRGVEPGALARSTQAGPGSTICRPVAPNARGRGKTKLLRECSSGAGPRPGPGRQAEIARVHRHQQLSAWSSVETRS